MLLLRKRYNDYQPCVMAVRGVKCQCGHKKVNEEHIFKCATEGHRQNRHTDMKLTIFAKQKNTGIVSSTEDSNLVPGDGQRRHADITGHHCKMSLEYFEKFGADVTVIYHDYQNQSSIRYRGIAASNAAKNKRTNMNTEQNLVFNGMKFYPLAFEVNGSIEKTVIQFIKRVSMVAQVRKRSKQKHSRTGGCPSVLCR